MKGDTGDVRDAKLYHELSDTQKQFLQHLSEIMNLDSELIWTAQTVYDDHAVECDACQESLRRIDVDETTVITNRRSAEGYMEDVVNRDKAVRDSTFVMDWP